ncbi:hypothetical protein WJ92_18825 [Burkholderia ubonensis]|uniref:dATP/dGTP pyrophosphohydrolase domain-containing protein n=1 Tax=Burkholderia ubonensis TaxID=101571 RepID=UPI00075B2312|nr:dATP/dGTP pyrophosphohydrolase domain-containing protein [Burkholderia ubonensis]KVP80418.1 hypothetical protein WJ92_18825 [Burkholderia ubonensis]
MVIQQLRDELRAAHTIIRNALGVMTFDQKLQWANANERDDAIGEGVTRANERQAVIDDGTPRALFVELRRADRIITNAWEIQSLHQHALWATANLQDGVAASHPTRADTRALVLAAAVDEAHGSCADASVGFVQGFGDVAPAESAAWCGIDAGDPAGDQAAFVLKPTCELSEAAVAEIRRALHDPKRNYSVTFMPPEFDMNAFLRRQRAFSENAFGPGRCTARVCDHIRKELIEVEAAPDDLREWVDVILLGLDGAWRTGATPEQITDALAAKLATNEGRAWPDWRTSDPDRAIEHFEQATKGGQA